jgi:hypothetical protein
MAVEIKLWKVGQEKLEGVQPAPLSNEGRLEEWLAKDIAILGLNLQVVGRQVQASFGGRIDLLCVDAQGNLVIVELKRDKTPRDVIAQVLDYASWVKKLTYDDVNGIANAYHHKTLDEILDKRFDPTPEKINVSHSMIIVASSLDASSERIVRYLSDEYDIPINVAFFTFFKDDGQELLGRAWLTDPEAVEEKANHHKPFPWSGYWFVNVGEGVHRNWDDSTLYGYIGAGQGEWYSRSLKRLHVDDRIFAYMSGKGYVGYGVVVAEAVPIREFRPEGQEKLLIELPLVAPQVRDNVDDDTLCEWVARVRWEKPFPRNEAKTFKGVFVMRHVVCKLWDERTIIFLKHEFGVQDDA